VLSFVLAGYTPEEVGSALDREGIAVRAGRSPRRPASRVPQVSPRERRACWRGRAFAVLGQSSETEMAVRMPRSIRERDIKIKLYSNDGNTRFCASPCARRYRHRTAELGGSRACGRKEALRVNVVLRFAGPERAPGRRDA
jgi:hypothetical protein